MHLTLATALDGILTGLFGGAVVAWTTRRAIKSAEKSAAKDRKLQARIARGDRLADSRRAAIDRLHAAKLVDAARTLDAATEATRLAFDVMAADLRANSWVMDEEIRTARFKRFAAFSVLFTARLQSTSPGVARTLDDLKNDARNSIEARSFRVVEILLNIYVQHVSWWVGAPEEVERIAPTAEQLTKVGNGWLTGEQIASLGVPHDTRGEHPEHDNAD